MDVSERFKARKCGYLIISGSELVVQIAGGEEVVAPAESQVNYNWNILSFVRNRESLTM